MGISLRRQKECIVFRPEMFCSCTLQKLITYRYIGRRPNAVLVFMSNKYMKDTELLPCTCFQQGSVL